MFRMPFDSTSEESSAVSPTISCEFATVSVDAVIPPSSSAATVALEFSATENDVPELLPMQTTSLDVGTASVLLLVSQLSAVVQRPSPASPVHESWHDASACAGVASISNAAPKDVNAVRTRAALAAARPKREPILVRHMRFSFHQCHPVRLLPPRRDTPNAAQRSCLTPVP